MRRRIVFIISMIIMLFIISSIYAQDSQKQVHVKKIKGGQCMDLPDLTEDQQAKIKEIHLNMNKAVLPLKGELEVLSAELKQLIITDKPNKSDVMKKVEVIGELRIKMQKLHMEAKLETRGLLTSEQRVKFDQRMLEDRRDMAGHPGMGGGKRIKKMVKIKKSGMPMEIDEDDIDVEIEEIEE
ncbi:Spy/CpxP family protein refolding chaperone [bacterium]